MTPRRIPLLALLLVAAACGGGTASPSSASTATTTTTIGATTTTTMPGFTVVSEDGDLEIDVPYEAMAEDPGITISVLAPEDYPAEFAPFADSGSVIYSLQPDGLTFDAPVRVTRRIPADRFTDLPEGAIPVVSLITTTADGSGFELLGDLRVLRNGEDVFVSGDLTHFSPNAAVNEPVYFKPRFTGYEFTTQVGYPLEATVDVYTYQGERLELPEDISSVAFTRHPDLVGFKLEAEYLELECLDEGESRLRFGFRMVLKYNAEDHSRPAPMAIRNFIPDLDRLPLMVKRVEPLVCLPMGFHNAEITGEVQTFHSGSGTPVPGNSYRGGPSAAMFQLSGYVQYFDEPRVGLVKDDGNGMLDAGDIAFPAFGVESYDGIDGVVMPLWSYGLYFPYIFDATEFGAPIDETMSFGEFLDLMEEQYDGEWFEGSIGIVTSFGEAFGYRVDASEEIQPIEGASLSILPPDVRLHIEVRLNF